MNNIPKHFLRKIQEAQNKQLKELHLDCNWGAPDDQKLPHIPAEVFELEHLEVLNLRGNRLTTVPNVITQLHSLTSIDLSDNKLTTLPDAIAQLSNLMWLNLSENELIVVPDAIGRLCNLMSLDLSANQLNAVPNTFAQLHNLTSLKLCNNKLTAAPDSIGQLRNLTSLDLSDNQLTIIPNTIAQLQNLMSLKLSNNKLISVPHTIAQLHNLTSLDLSDNQLTAVPNEITQLYNLTLLDLSSNRLTAVPDAMDQLQKLTLLSLGGNLFTAIPAIIYELFSLIELSFGNYSHTTNQIKEIYPKILQLKNLKKLNLERNPIETPPLEVVNKGVEAIKNYFWQLEAKGKDYLYEAKLLIVGEGGAGKTTLAKKIENPNCQLREDETSTEGIDVIQWRFPMENEKPFRVNIWDFGGQEIYHATHQFFLTKRSLYALVADTRKEDTDFYYWLNVVELLSDNSPLIIIKNEKQDRHREINERLLRGQFTTLKETLATNLATNRGLSEILKEIKHHIRQLPHIGTLLPKTWVKVREALEKDFRNHISLDEYLNICQKNGFTELKDSLQLSGYLHDLGVCLHFQEDPLLRKTVILKPKWGTDAVYKVLDNKTVIRNLGQFTRSDLANIWNAAEYAKMQDELLQLMINFKLCYKIPRSQYTYIAPQLLTENQPEYEWEAINNLILRYTYEFMPKGILTQFIVAMHPFIANQTYVWKSGVILEKDQTQAEVIEYYGKREIKIRLVGKQKKELMAIVIYELDQIHASYRRLKYSKLIPCNCSACKDNPEPHFYPYEILRKFAEDRQNRIQCQKSYQMVEVRGLIDDVIDRRRVLEEQRELRGVRHVKPAPQKFTKMRIFVASPSDMATEREKLDVIIDSLKPLAEKEGLILEVVDWRKVVPDAGRPQQVIFDQLKPTTWDIFIGILWHRFGSLTGAANPATQKEYSSGTYEEFMTVYRLWEKFKQPRIMMYRCTRPIPPNALDPDQFKRVNEFFAQFDGSKGEHPVLYQTFDTVENFEKLLREHLQQVLLKYNEME